MPIAPKPISEPQCMELFSRDPRELSDQDFANLIGVARVEYALDAAKPAQKAAAAAKPKRAPRTNRPILDTDLDLPI